MPIPVSEARFANGFWSSLPGDKLGPVQHPRLTPDVCFARSLPERAPAPALRAWSGRCAALLGFPEVLPATEKTYAADVFSGQNLPPGTQPYAMRYGGHQFGNWAGQLGDGRVINLGELRDVQGSWQTIQLKGAGPTPYSRSGDGRAVLRSSIREFIASEAMASLGVPTSRALALVTTGHEVMRDLLYDGNPRMEIGTVVTRVAPSFLRLGNFEIHAAMQELPLHNALLDFALKHHFPELKSDPLALYAEVCKSTAELMARWMGLGFVHGVMNTDNLSLLGLTIDYGPFGFMEQFDPRWTPNEVDQSGRYAYANQPRIAQWNLSRFGSAFAATGVPVSDLEAILRLFHAQYNEAFYRDMAAKLGLREIPGGDGRWLEALFEWMEELQLDWTILFRGLAECLRANEPQERFRCLLVQASYLVDDEASPELKRLPAWARAEHWFTQWRNQLEHVGLRVDGAELAAAMDAVNPASVPRNWVLGEVITQAENNNFAPLEALLDQVQTPFRGSFVSCLQGKRPSWAIRRPGCGRLTCSS